LQKQIEEEIRQEQIQENIEQALEYTPETFGRVVMLYIDVEVNKVPVKAFVDSGAQQTIMSQRCAERCGIMRLLDRKFAGIAKGVGTARILGRIHLVPIKIGNSFFPCSFSVLEESSLDFLLGLDMLRRHQCIIDLRENVLKIGDEKVPFLAEKDIPLAERAQELLEEENMAKEYPSNSNKTNSAPPSFSSSASSRGKESKNVPMVTMTPSTPSLTSSSAPSSSASGTTSASPKSPSQGAKTTAGSSTPLHLQSPVQNFPESAIRQLMELGYSREEAVRALR